MPAANRAQDAQKNTGNDQAQLVQLPLRAISPFEHNPRTSRNPEYDRLVASIQRNGLEQPLLVAKKPKQANYVLQAGGNTRLAILNELFEQGDLRFEHVPCIVQPWISDLHALISHLRETEMHGSLLFIERARAIMQIGELIATQDESQNITQRGLADLLQNYGYPLSQTMISYMDYAVNRLYPHMPRALDRGLGKPRIVRIRNLEKSANRIWNRETNREEDSFDEMFEAICQRYDADDWDIDAFESALNYELSVAFDMDQTVARIMFSEEQSGRRLPDVVPAIPQSEANHEQAAKPIRDEETNAKIELRRLRKKSLKNARKFAETANLGDLIKSVGDSLFGYIVSDLPPDDRSKFALTVWLTLLACCEQTRATKSLLRQLLPTDSRLVRALSEERFSSLIDRIGLCRLAECGERLFSLLDDDGWLAFMNLVSTYRSIRLLANRLEIDIWKDL